MTVLASPENATCGGNRPHYNLSNMAKQVEHFDDDDLSEILRLAVRKQDSTTTDLRNRLLAVADELGISHEAIAEAELEYRQQTSQREELALYAKETKNGLKIHLGVFGIINVFLVGINLLTLHEDKEIWFPYAFLGWGIAVAIHAFVAMRKVDWDDEEFQKWRRERAAKRAEVGQ